MNAELVRLFAEISAVNAKIAGMTAQNQIAISKQEYPYYDFSDFDREACLLDRLGQEAIANRTLDLN